MSDSEQAWLDKFFDDVRKRPRSAGGAPVSGEIPPSPITTDPKTIVTANAATKTPVAQAASPNIPPIFQQECYDTPMTEGLNTTLISLNHTHGFRPPTKSESIFTISARLTESIFDRVQSTYDKYGPYILGGGILLVGGLWHRHDAKKRSRRHVRMAVTRIIQMLEVNREYSDMITDQKRWGELCEMMCQEVNQAYLAKQLRKDECVQAKESLKRKLASNELYISHARRKKRRDDEYKQSKEHHGWYATPSVDEPPAGSSTYIARGPPLISGYSDEPLREGEVIQVRRSVHDLKLGEARKIALAKELAKSAGKKRPDEVTKPAAPSDPGVGSSKTVKPGTADKTGTTPTPSEKTLMPPPAKKVRVARPPKEIRTPKKVTMIPPPKPTAATKATGKAGKKPGGSDTESLTGSEAGSRRSSRPTLFTGTYPK